MDSYTLGLDIGSNSIGWAIIQDADKPSIINMGVRVFPEGVDRDTKGQEMSKNANRRQARGSRRVHSRRNQRRDRLLNTLQRFGFLPTDGVELSNLFKKDPYTIRAEGLDRELSLYELGRAIFHINQRRGFKSNRKAGESKEQGLVEKQAGELQRKIDAEGCRTIGEYFATLKGRGEKVRGWYTFRSMYEKEFELLWAKQAEFYPDELNEEFKNELRNEIIFYQRPLKPVDDFIGECELEPGENRCPRGDWDGRRFRILQDVNNLKIRNPDGSENGLSKEQRERILTELLKKKRVTFDSLRKKLNLIESQLFNFEQGGRKALAGDEFAEQMRSNKAFGTKGWNSLSEEDKRWLNEARLEMPDDELKQAVIQKFKLPDAKAASISKVTLTQGYHNYSKKAIRKLLPYMEKGLKVHEAISEAGYERTRTQIKGDGEKLGLPPDLRNPIVQKALFEVRKVVNSIIREYGSPSRIKIEMARDLKNSKRRRLEIQKRNNDNKKFNEKARKRLIEDIGISNPTRDDILKYKLWIECETICPYTGKEISQIDLFGEHPVFQVEHILPYSRSLDNSYMNKTLCHVDENRLKNKQTPFEAYGEDEGKFEQIKQRIKKLPWPKRRRFLQKEINLDKQIERELNDTRYITKEVISYLKTICSNVQGTKGQATAPLRRNWGLENILENYQDRRDDHRRHSVDAFITAITNNRHLRNIARKRFSQVENNIPEPWKGFREEVKIKANKINVSHRVTRKVSGQLHEETAYGPTSKEVVFVYRKKLEDLTPTMAEKIVDQVVRGIIKKRLDQNGIDHQGNNRIPKKVWEEPLYMKSKKGKKVPIKKVRIQDVISNVIMLKDTEGHPYRGVTPGKNHHVEIFEYKGEDGKVELGAEVVTMFEAVKRSRKGEEVIKRTHGLNTRFICSLAINEMVMLPDKNGKMDLYRVQKMSTTKQVYFRHHTASRIDNEKTLIRKQANLFDGYKVTVDPLGRVHRAND